MVEWAIGAGWARSPGCMHQRWKRLAPDTSASSPAASTLRRMRDSASKWSLAWFLPPYRAPSRPVGGPHRIYSGRCATARLRTHARTRTGCRCRRRRTCTAWSRAPWAWPCRPPSPATCWASIGCRPWQSRPYCKRWRRPHPIRAKCRFRRSHSAYRGWWPTARGQSSACCRARMGWGAADTAASSAGFLAARCHR